MRSGWGPAVAVVALLLGGCGTATSAGPAPVADGNAAAPSASQPTMVPAPEGLVRPKSAVTVLDDGDGAELCWAVLDSLPPQCGGLPLVGWDWADHEGDYESRAGVRWGEFELTGTFDGTAFTPTRVVPYDRPDPALPTDAGHVTPCAVPDGGWPLDPPRSDQRAFDRATDIAVSTKGYVMHWVDQSINPVQQQWLETGDNDLVDLLNDPGKTILNVQTTGDPAELERAIREVWGGALCVTQVEHGRDELDRIQREVNELPGFLGSGAGNVENHVELTVVYDDGRYQAWADATYGEGLVAVDSALRPVG